MRSPCAKEKPVNREKRAGDPVAAEMREIADRLSRLESLENDLKKTVDSLKRQEEINYSLLDALSANIAVLDREGTILFTNGAWQRYARENGLGSAPDSVGVNYLDSSRQTASGSTEIREIDARIRDVLTGRREELLWEYPCHSPDRKRWFRMRVNRFAGSGPVRVLVCHEDVTPLKVAGLVRDGRSSKEIAGLLNLSLSAVEFHRDHLRKKLKLGSRKTSLRSFLRSQE
jgi:PAS domain-containing protein